MMAVFHKKLDQRENFLHSKIVEAFRNQEAAQDDGARRTMSLDIVHSSHESTPLPELDAHGTFTVDKIIEQPTPCRLHLESKFFRTKVAT